MSDKIQFGESLTGDLKESTWTFEVKNLKLQAGEFAIVPKEDYLQLVKSLQRCALSMSVHPDNEPNSEFRDCADGAWDAIKKVKS